MNGGLRLEANPGKRLEITVDQGVYLRIPVRTRTICARDDIVEVVREYAAPLLQPGDLIVVSEKTVAITQGRFYHLEEVKPSWLARFLSRFVHKSPHGQGLGCPHTMELALREAGALKVIFASLVAALGKLFGIRGLFYRILGDGVRSIDGASTFTVEPYQNCIILAPKDPRGVAEGIKKALGCSAAVIDANDLGVNILGASGPEVDVDLLCRLLQDNPLGQSGEQTPIGIIRRVVDEEARTGCSAS